MNNRLIVFLLLLAIATPSAFATSMELPNEVFQDLSFNVVLTCDGTGVCVVNWTSPGAVDDGNFTENASDPDPDVANEQLAFSALGTYTVSLHECPSGNVSNCTFVENETVDVVNLSGEVATLLALLDALNMSVDDVNTDLDALNVSLQTQIDLLSTMVASNYNNITNNSAAIAALNLTTLDLQNQIDNLTTNVTDLFNITSDLQSQINNITTNVTDIFGTISLIESNITEIYAILTVIEGNITVLDLRVLGLETNVSNIFDLLVRTNHATINLLHEYNESAGVNDLSVFGEAPEGVNNATIQVYSIAQIPFSDTPIYEESGVSVNVVNNTYEFTVDLNDSVFSAEKYNIVVFFDDGLEFVVSSLFDDLLLIWLEQNTYGFSLVDSQTVETFNPQANFTRHISWAFTPEEDGEWSFRLQHLNANTSNISKEFAGGTFFALTSQVMSVFEFQDVQFPPNESNYRVELQAYNNDTGETVKSNVFWFEVIDLALPLPNNTAGISELGILQSNVTGIHYTSNTFFDFDVLMQSTTGWSSALDCIVRYDDGLGGQDVKIWDMSAPNASNVSSCNGTLNVESITGLNAGMPWTLEVCAEPREHNPSGLDQLCDTIDMMYDATPPAIDESSLNPGTLDVLRGVWNFSANVSDNGEVLTVEFELINKTDAGDVCALGFANQTTPGFWQLEYDTAGNCTPDGFYNFSVTATDFAGNIAVLEIDPPIDNTAPVIQNVALAGFLGSNMTVEALITDNLMGVLKANATIQRYTCDDINTTVCVIDTCVNKTFDAYNDTINLSLTSGTSLNGTWTGDFTQDAGWFYQVVVHTLDQPGNNATPYSSDRFARPSYTVTATTTKGTFTTSEQVVVSGKVTSSDSSTLPVNVIDLDGASIPLMLDMYSTNLGLLSVADYAKTATYSPEVICNETYNATAVFTVESLPTGGGGGGGGGGTWHPLQQATQDEPDEPVKTQESDTTETPVSTGEDVESDGTSSTTSEDTEQENLVTGAVTGTGFFGENWPWLTLFLGLLVLLFGAYFWLRR